MCGRTACTLAPSEICRACQYEQRGKKVQPAWLSDGEQYQPSFNMSPGQNTPVLLSAEHFKEHSSGEAERVIRPMRWGLVPSWYKGDPKKVGFKMNNCRSDGMLQKSSFKVPLQKGQRCVVLADGFYEWKTSEDGKKQPYFIYFPKGETSDTEQKNISVKIEKEEELETFETDGGKRSRLLTMAGVFDTWSQSDYMDGETLYTYSIITVDASSTMSWLHHRMPAILETDQDVQQWLDFGEVPLNKAVQLVQPVTCVQYHPVSTTVNNTRNNMPECVLPIDLSKKKISASGNMMQAWLKKGSKSQDTPSIASDSKTKLEEKSSGRNANSLTKWLSTTGKNTEADNEEPKRKKPKLEN